MRSNLFPQPISLDGYQLILGGCSEEEQLKVSHGNLVRKYFVVRVPTLAVSLDFKITHNSGDNYLGPVGRNWRHEGQQFLSFSGSPVNLVTYTDEQGAQMDFEWDSVNSVWKRQTDSKFEPVTLTQNGSNWKLSFYPDGATLNFDSSGRLTSLEDKNGNALSYGYSGGNLVSISEPGGRSLSFGYSSGKLASVTDPNGNQTLFHYDANSNLVSIIVSFRRASVESTAGAAN